MNLFKLTKSLKCKFVMSNSCVKMILDNFKDYEIEKVEILYKESDSSAVRVIAVENIQDSNTTGSIEYVYKSTNFLSTISEDQLTRAFDNVPTRALAQEIAGNRLIYGNYSTKKALPDIDFDFPYNMRDEVFLKLQMKF